MVLTEQEILWGKNAIHISVSDSKKDSFVIVRLVDICLINGG